MTSIFGFDLAEPAATNPGLCGVVNGASATAAVTAISAHFSLPFDQVRETLRKFLPQAAPHLRSPEGWALLGSYFGIEVPDAPAFEATIH